MGKAHDAESREAAVCRGRETSSWEEAILWRLGWRGSEDRAEAAGGSVAQSAQYRSSARHDTSAATLSRQYPRHFDSGPRHSDSRFVSEMCCLLRIE